MSADLSARSVLTSCGVRRTFLLLTALAAGYLGLKLYGQHRAVTVYVQQFRPMPAALAKNLPLKKQRLLPLLMTDVLYAQASHKILSPEEIARVRAALAWSGPGLNWVDTIHIQSPAIVWAEKKSGLDQGRIYLIKYETGWRRE